MSMTTVSNLNGEGGRTFAIDVRGNPQQAGQRAAAYTIKVPYSSLAQTIHSIGQRGGKVIDVKLLTAQLSDLGQILVASKLDAFEEQVAPKPPAKQTRNLEPEPRRQQSKSKKR